ncbi:uncharacterized protein LOC110678811 isoform X2 [Aedes aegypti]|uniref:Uncharacterized protein n=1 Tax=Aedes aegypti TaxID=7159 RepID=A0A6I8U7C5_AEDAE|nr:uncharacterized protein LOC110678811 isoform X2 [Aedes aegypti]
MARQLSVTIVILILNCVMILGAPTREDVSIQPTAGIDNQTNLSAKLSVKRSADQNTVRKVILDDQEIEIVKAILYGFVESNGVNYQI